MLERPRSDSEYADEKGGTGPLDVFGGKEEGIEEGNVVIQFGKVAGEINISKVRSGAGDIAIEPDSPIK